MSGKRPAIGIDADRDRLAHFHVGQLRFLEVGGDPYVEWNDDHDRLARNGEGPDCGCEFGDAAIDSGAQFHALQVGIGLGLLGLALRDVRKRACFLCLQYVGLALGRRARGLRGVECGLLALQIARCLLRTLHGARSRLQQILIALVLVLRKFQRACASLSCFCACSIWARCATICASIFFADAPA